MAKIRIERELKTCVDCYACNHRYAGKGTYNYQCNEAGNRPIAMNTYPADMVLTPIPNWCPCRVKESKPKFKVGDEVYLVGVTADDDVEVVKDIIEDVEHVSQVMYHTKGLDFAVNELSVYKTKKEAEAVKSDLL